MCEEIIAAMRRVARVAKTPLVLSAALLLSGCDIVVLNPTGYIAIQQRNLVLVATGLMLLIIIPVLVLTVLFAWRYRAGSNAKYDPEFDHSMPLELVIWGCPLLIIVCLGAITWTSTHLLDPFRPLDHITADRAVPAGTKPLVVQVVALDWKWLFIYPGQNIATINELALPIDTPVEFAITSSNQMNTFFAPTMAGMIYAMPGMQTMLHAVLNKPGTSEGFSANYTGSGFSWMRFKLLGMDQAGFAKWVQGVRAAGPDQKGALTPTEYVALDKPTENVPVTFFNSVTASLFDHAVNQCVQPGRPCEANVMMADAQKNVTSGSARHGEGTSAVRDIPAANEGQAVAGDRPVPALMKKPEDKGDGPNVTAPAPSKPGQPAHFN